MINLEDELKNALRRLEPPEDFAERTLLKISEANEALPRARFRFFPMRAPRWAFAVIALLLLAVAGAGAYRQAALEEERRRGEEAKEQLMLALRIAAGKLQIVQARVHQADAYWEYQEEEGD